MTDFLPHAISWCLMVGGTAWMLCAAALTVGLLRLKASAGIARPRVSVLVAARDEEVNIAACLEALKGQDYPVEDWELILIDDHSTDRTAAIAREIGADMPNFRLLAAPAPPGTISPKKSALKAGIAAAKGEVILTTDADCTPPPGWVRLMAGQFEPGVVAVVGFSPLDSPGLAGAVSGLDALVNAVAAAGTVGLGRPVTAVGRNFAYRRKGFYEAGGFEASGGGASGDDDLLLQRLAAGGGKVTAALGRQAQAPARGATTLRGWLRMKRRHLSAGKRYPPVLVAASSLLYMFNLSLAAAALTEQWGILTGWMGAKFVVDGLALKVGSGKLDMPMSWLTFAVAEVLSALFFTVMLPVSVVGGVVWKGRRLRG